MVIYHAHNVEKTLYRSKMVIRFAHARSNILEQRQKLEIVLQHVTVSVIFFIFAPGALIQLHTKETAGC